MLASTQIYICMVALHQTLLVRGLASLSQKCAITDIAITSARNNIFWQDKKQLIGHREGFIYFWYRGVQGACQHPNIPLLYIKLCIYRGWQASHRKCAIYDIAITSARNNIFWQDKKQLIGHREGFIYFRSRVGQGACQHPNIPLLTSNFVYIGGGKQSQEMCDFWFSDNFG